MTLGFLLLLTALVGLSSWFAVHWFTRYLVRNKLFDQANARSLHSGAIPRGAGAVVMCFTVIACVLSGLIFARLSMFLTLGMLISLSAALGWWDDHRDLSAGFRLVLQVVLALVAIAMFGYINQLRYSSDHVVYLGFLGAVLTVLGIVWFTNLYNFMDGMDGLVASQTIIASVTIAMWFWQVGDFGFMLVLLVMAAATYGFLLHNWSPAKVFLGDVGSIGLGTAFALFFIIANTRYNIPILSFVLLFWVFIWDATLTVLVRLAKRETIWQAHRSHLYQRAAQQGFRHSYIVIFNIVLMIVCSIISSAAIIDPNKILLYAGFLFTAFGVLSICLYARSNSIDYN